MICHDETLLNDLCERLYELRRTLRYFLKDHARYGSATNIGVLLEIKDKRRDIGRLKAELRRLGVDVDDQFDDTDPDAIAHERDGPPQPDAAGDSSCGVLACPPWLRRRLVFCAARHVAPTPKRHRAPVHINTGAALKPARRLSARRAHLCQATHAPTVWPYRWRGRPRITRFHAAC
ncbi:MAG TPA: hypothetical protein PLO33_08820 [Kouleothrix sp.]|nr:hypothetical protein [Kouleothrix sp.]HRC75769.1 hypothetical protein [Kouleothrix sp.]